jgi:hypothetical protein
MYFLFQSVQVVIMLNCLVNYRPIYETLLNAAFAMHGCKSTDSDLISRGPNSQGYHEHTTTTTQLAKSAERH